MEPNGPDLSRFSMTDRLRIMSREMEMPDEKFDKTAESPPEKVAIASAVESPVEDEAEFMPASRIVHEEELLLEDVARPEPSVTAVTDAERFSVLADTKLPGVPHYLRAYVFPRGNISRFPSPKRDASGFASKYINCLTNVSNSV